MSGQLIAGARFWPGKKRFYVYLDVNEDFSAGYTKERLYIATRVQIWKAWAWKEIESKSKSQCPVLHRYEKKKTYSLRIAPFQLFQASDHFHCKISSSQFLTFYCVGEPVVCSQHGINLKRKKQRRDHFRCKVLFNIMSHVWKDQRGAAFAKLAMPPKFISHRKWEMIKENEKNIKDNIFRTTSATETAWLR